MPVPAMHSDRIQRSWSSREGRSGGSGCTETADAHGARLVWRNVAVVKAVGCRFVRGRTGITLRFTATRVIVASCARSKRCQHQVKDADDARARQPPRKPAGQSLHHCSHCRPERPGVTYATP